MLSAIERLTFRPSQVLIPLAVLAICVFAGLVVVKYVDLAGGNPLRLAALPFGILLGMALLLDKERLFVAILILRAGGDVVLASSKFDLGGYAIGIGGLVNAMVLAIALIYFVRSPKVLPGRLAWPWGLFFALLVLGVMRAPMMGDAVRIALGLMSYAAVFLVAYHMVTTGKSFDYCVRVVLWSTLIPILGGLWAVATGSSGEAGEFRLAGLFSHPNIFAFYLTIAIGLVLYQMKRPGATNVNWLGLLMLMLLGLLVLTKTRSAWISCATTFVAYALFFERRYLAYLAVAPLVALALPDVRERLLDLGSGNEYYTYAKLNSFAWRQLIWETGLNWMKPSGYILGYGLEAFVFHSVSFFPLAGGKGAGAHNIYVQLFFDLGAVGLLAFVMIFASVVREVVAWRRVNRLGAAVVLLLILGYLVSGFSDNMLAYLVFNWYFWFICGAACASAAATAAPVAVRSGHGR